MSKVSRLNARCKVTNRAARRYFPSLAVEQKKAFGKVKEKWQNEIIPQMHQEYCSKLKKAQKSKPL